MAGNKALNNANKAQNDEFYTQLADIERELYYYRGHFKNKVIFCNCDDPYESNFFKYFAMNFNQFGLKKLMSTSFGTSSIIGTQLTLPGIDYGVGIPQRSPYKTVITEVQDLNEDGRFDLQDIEILLSTNTNVVTRMEGDGDFQSEESIEMLKQADIVVTNPPFSLFSKYVEQLNTYGKKFIIIGNQNAITYKEIFPLIMQNKIWLGWQSGDMAFRVPAYYEERETRFWIDETGQKWRSLGNICWFTNLDIKKRHESLTLYKKYTPEEFPKFDNYDAINVDKVAEIPCDYEGVMGVPITFLNKHNPKQFEIIGATESEGKGFSMGLWDSSSKTAQPLLYGKRKFKRIFIKRIL